MYICVRSNLLGQRFFKYNRITTSHIFARGLAWYTLYKCLKNKGSNLRGVRNKTVYVKRERGKKNKTKCKH